MKTQNYRLELIQKDRNRKKDECLRLIDSLYQDLQKAQVELKRRENLLAQCQKRFISAEHQINAQFGRNISSYEIKSRINDLKKIKEYEINLITFVENQYKNLQLVKKTLHEAKELLNKILLELKVIDQHKEKWEKTLSIKIKKSEQRAIDEIASILFQQTDQQRNSQG